MKIVCISDTHNKHNKLIIPDGNIILHAGDSTGRGKRKEIESFIKWYGGLPHTYKVLIAGNHDWGFDSARASEYEELCDKHNIIYLNDSECVITDFDTGEDIKIWGSPVQPEFFNWAFNRARSKPESRDFGNQGGYNHHDFIGTHWDMIPKDTDILITHGPAHGFLDQVKMLGSPNLGQNVGCELLADKIAEIKPKLHVSGHIHEARGVFVDKLRNITYVNASSLDERYIPYVDEAFVFDWEKVKTGGSRGRD